MSDSFFWKLVRKERVDGHQVDVVHRHVVASRRRVGLGKDKSGIQETSTIETVRINLRKANRLLIKSLFLQFCWILDA